MSISYVKSYLHAVCAAVVACALTCGSAHAQSTTTSGFAIDRFEPAGGGSEWFSLETLDFRGHLRPAAGLSADLALDPVVIYDRAGNKVTSLVSHQAKLHADVALVLWSRLRLDVNAPAVVWHDGTAGMVGGMSYEPPSGQPLGDIRLGVDVRLLGKARDAITVALGGQVFLPTGHQGAFTSDGSARLWPRLSVAGEAGLFVWAARVGYHYRPTYKCGCDLTPGSEVTGGLAVGVRALPTMLVGAELYAATPATSAGFAKPVASPIELLMGVHLAVSPDWSVGVGAAPGTDGPGSPSWRFVASVQYYPAFTPRVFAPEPAVPTLPVAAPPPQPRPTPAPPPPPPLPPPPPPPPSDRDGDGIVDPADACPDAAGPSNENPERNGCPVARIENGQIRIREQVKFKTDSAAILKESNYILSGVVKILVENPEIKRLRVEGHTDTQGKPKYNKKLSERRAASVVKWLVKAGISKRRLKSAGFGQERPLANNQTEDGRRENRRVEFHIVEGPGGER